MKKIIICAFCALLSVLIILAFQTSKLLDTSEIMSEKLKYFPSVKEAFAKLTDSESNFYIVKKYNEKIGIFKNGNKEPDKILDVFVFSLPERDRLLLDIGFTIGEESLDSVIEDYTG